jgi:hypothetical protein
MRRRWVRDRFVRRFANRRAGLAIGAVGVVLVVAVVLVAKDDKPTPGQQARLALRDAATRQRRGCDHRPGFRIYTLGARFRGDFAAHLGDRCEAYTGDVIFSYGPCQAAGESGCNFSIDVVSQPVCLRPRALARAFGDGPHGDSGPRTVTTLRGVPAAVFKNDTIVLMTRDTLITISADARPAREAVDALRPAAGPGATTLPKPNAWVVDGELRNRQCPA